MENKYKSPAGTQTNTYSSHFSIFSICLFFFLDVQRTVRMCANCCEWVKISAGTVQAQLQSPHGYQRPRKQSATRYWGKIFSLFDSYRAQVHSLLSVYPCLSLTRSYSLRQEVKKNGYFTVRLTVSVYPPPLTVSFL